MTYILENPGIVLAALLRHLQITGLALAVSLAIALPTALLVARRRALAGPVMGLLGVLYTVPSLALIILLVPVFGLNATSVTVALVVYMQVILVRNVLAGLQSIDPVVGEASVAMGFTAWQRWWRVQLPLALPHVLAGVRIAAIVGIGVATIGAKFNAGGLGTLLFEGIAQAGRHDKILAGAIAVGGLALGVNAALLALESIAAPRGVRRPGTKAES
jgi:osmoprotectant transport system permease protein